MEAIVQPQALTALILGKEPSSPIENKAGCTPEPVWKFCRRKNLSVLPRYEPWTI
jgi:hypothetical protein